MGELPSLGQFVEQGVPAILFTLVCLNIIQSVFIWLLWGSMRDLKTSITWGNTCNERHTRIDERLDKAENKINGIRKE